MCVFVSVCPWTLCVCVALNMYGCVFVTVCACGLCVFVYDSNVLSVCVCL